MLQSVEGYADWQARRDFALHSLGLVNRAFPALVMELKGYAEGAGASFEDLWTLCLEEEYEYVDKCTTIVTNGGKLTGHNEDWDISAQDGLCVLKKSIGSLTILELFYLNTLGGNAISINSHGIVQAINSLPIYKHQDGIPRNIMARWVSQARSLKEAVQGLLSHKRSSGYHHTLVDLIEGASLSIECSARKAYATKPVLPFVHTNHYIAQAYAFEEEDEDRLDSRMRYQLALKKAMPHMSETSLKELLGDRRGQHEHDVFNERTIARMVVNQDEMRASIWLLREKERGWVDYPIDFISH
jgi:hypothetical protein